MRADNFAVNFWRKRKIKGIVTKILSFEHYVCGEDNKTYLCRLRGKQRLVGEVYVGDSVEFSGSGKNFNIEKVYPRKNSLVRPYVANIDTALIVIAQLPAPDMCLVDKLIANCIKNDINPVICINKQDVASDEFLRAITTDYGKYFKIIQTSARSGEGIDSVKKEIENKTVCLCGQSAVGKTTMINAITGRENETGGLSKISRGRNTTRHVEMYAVANGYIVDTCGFSLLEIDDIDYRELSLYYPEFDEGRGECKFSTCTHTAEPDCEIKRMVEKGEISKNRYLRYVTIFNEIKQKGGRY